MRRAAAWVIFILLLVAAFLAAWFLPADGTSAPVAPPPAAPVPPPRPPVVPAAPAAPAEPAESAEPEEAPPAAGPRLERWLEGTVKFEDGAPAAGAGLHALALHEGQIATSVKGVAGPGGAFRLDVTSRKDSPRSLEDLIVRVDHTEATPESRPVTMPQHAFDEDRPVVRIPLEIVLPRAAVVTGRVVDSRGAPVRGADVAALAPLSDAGQPEWGVTRGVDVATTGDAGDFRLRLKASERCAIVADAVGKRAASREWAGTAGPIPELVLEDAASISGKVTDAGGRPLAGARVRAERADEEGASAAARGVGRLNLESGRFVGLDQAVADADSAADGSFTLSDLDPGPHRVTVEGLGEHAVLADAFEDAARDAQAPSTGVVLRLDFVRARLEVRVDGEPPPEGASVLITSRHRNLVDQGMGLPKGGVLEVLARPGSSYVMRLDASPHRFEERKFLVPEGSPTAAVRIDFGRLGARASLLVIASAAGGVPARAGFGLFEPDEPGNFATAVRRDVAAQDGRFLLNDLPAGRWRLIVRAGGSWSDGEGLFLDETLEVEVPAEGQAEARVTLRPGGRIRVAARNRDQQFVQADCGIEDGLGNPVAVSFVVSRGDDAFVATTGGLIGGGENLVVPALPEGTYTLRFGGEGWVEKSETVQVRAGETTLVSVVLDRTK